MAEQEESMNRIPLLENILQPRGLALRCGITPGDFRFVTEVTASALGFLSSK